MREDAHLSGALTQMTQLAPAVPLGFDEGIFRQAYHIAPAQGIKARQEGFAGVNAIGQQHDLFAAWQQGLKTLE
jgi:hypothetical protein